MQEWLIGLETILQLQNLLLVFLGVFIGITFASLPGLNNLTAMILMLPFVYDMPPVPAMIFMCSIYGGGIHGGCILAILFRIPGEPQSVCTCFDGYPMAQQGKSAEAMGIAFTYSSLGGLFGVLVCIIMAPLISRVADAFGPAEYFAFVVFGLVVASSVGTASMLKGLIGACAGLLLGTVGVSPGSGVMRFTGDIHVLKMGFQYVPIIMGVFALSELLKMLLDGGPSLGHKIGPLPRWTVKLPNLSFIKHSFKTFLRSAASGALVGFLPGAGATSASFVAYGLEVKHSKNPEKYGKGEPKGVVAAETANNASYGGAMIPMLTMGIPGSSSTAVMLSVLMLKGIQPSPAVFQNMPEMIYGVFAAMLLVNFVMFAQSIFFGRMYLNMLKLPKAAIYFIIVVFCTVGTFSIRSSIEDVWIMAFFGLLGYGMDKTGFPTASLVLGVILANMAEVSFIQAVDSAGSPSPLIFFASPVSATLMSTAILLLVYPLFKRFYRKRKTNRNLF